MTWFGAKYPPAVAVPVIVHPLRKLGHGATAVSGMRVMTEEELKKLRKALEAFAKALSDPDTLNNAKKVNELVNVQGFDAEFLARYEGPAVRRVPNSSARLAGIARQPPPHVGLGQAELPGDLRWLDASLEGGPHCIGEMARLRTARQMGRVSQDDAGAGACDPEPSE